MNRLARHEAAQRYSRLLREASGARTLSFSTTEVVDYLCIDSNGCMAVEIKTGSSHLSKRQRAWCAYPALPTVVETWYWESPQGWTLAKEVYYAPAK